HEVILTGQHRCDTARFTKDIIRICQYHMQFFGMPIPIDRYVFLMQVTGNGYGGLEHRNSAALYISREALPVIGEEQAKEDYVNLLGLISHEYFHTWNVKRIKPAVFSPYELRRENYTRELWLYEGVTSYYDDLALLRCKLISLKTWCDIVSKTINRVLSGPGRLIQSVSEASFDAWIKFYRQDENAVNSQVSYYAKGALVAFALDMVLRHETQGEKSLDHLMRQLWQQYGSINRPLIEGEVEVLASGLCGKDLSYFFNQYIRGTEDLPLGDFVTQFGLMLKEDLPKKSALGVRFENNSLKIASVLTGSCAHESGLSAGDEIVSINQLRIPVNYFSRHIESYLPDSVITVHAFRNDELRVFEVKLKPLPYSNWSLLIDESVIDEKVISQRKAWMEGIPPN
ncbi:MAG: M61 family metallopeptidase, partial [Pseudomonadota bacterium]|nr:M61 family metallopeptidase [Pseudomonadota bacterium]